MDPERVALVSKMVGLVNQLFLLETCCPQLSCEPRKSAGANYSIQSSTAKPKKYHHACAPQATKTRPHPCVSNPSRATSAKDRSLPCFMLKCKVPKCKSDPDQEPLITWTPMLEVRKTTNPKNLERQNDNPTTKYVYVEPPGCPYRPVWSTKDPMCEDNCGPPKGCPALGPPPGYNGAPIELCCPGGRGPPVDRWGQAHDCKQTLDGRAVCQPAEGGGSYEWCEPKTTPFRKCGTTTRDSEPRSLLTRGKVLNQRFNVCNDREDPYPSTSLYKRPIWPRKKTCDDGRCRCPDNPSRKVTVRSRNLTSRC